MSIIAGQNSESAMRVFSERMLRHAFLEALTILSVCSGSSAVAQEAGLSFGAPSVPIAPSGHISLPLLPSPSVDNPSLRLALALSQNHEPARKHDASLIPVHPAGSAGRVPSKAVYLAVDAAPLAPSSLAQVNGGGVPQAATRPDRKILDWEVSPADGTLRATFARWAAVANWQLVWNLDVDYTIETRAVLAGSFEDAVGMVAKSLEQANVPMQAIFYGGNKVLRIVAKRSE